MDFKENVVSFNGDINALIHHPCITEQFNIIFVIADDFSKINYPIKRLYYPVVYKHVIQHCDIIHQTNPIVIFHNPSKKDYDEIITYVNNLRTKVITSFDKIPDFIKNCYVLKNYKNSDNTSGH